MENLYDLKDRFKAPTNCKTNSSSMKFEIINLGTKDNLQNANLGLIYTSSEIIYFIRLLKQYKYIFAWNYIDLKTYDTSIIQHIIPLKPDVKHVQQNLGKIHPNSKQQIKNEMNKLLKAKIIFLVRHSHWVSNLVPIRKKNGDIRICIDFRNLNKASEKDNFPLPPMEQILQSIAGVEMMSFLDGFSGYNKIMVSKDDQLKQHFELTGAPIHIEKCILV